MAFEKGHKGYGGGRKPGQKTGTGKKKQKNSSLDVHRNHHQWKKQSLKKSLDIDEVDYYLYNDLPIEELYDELKLYSYDWKAENKRYNLNNQAKRRKDNGNEGM